MRIEFETTQDLKLENSFSVIHSQDKVLLDVEINIEQTTDGEYYGNFEMYDIETGGEDWYAEGVLEFEGESLTGYDGVFNLPYFIVERIEEQGFKIEL
jgi:hypothetical protein